MVTPFQYRLFGAVPENERDRGLKFIRAAYVWFIVATAMLVFTPIYNFGTFMSLFWPVVWAYGCICADTCFEAGLAKTAEARSQSCSTERIQKSLPSPLKSHNKLGKLIKFYLIR